MDAEHRGKLRQGMFCLVQDALSPVVPQLVTPALVQAAAHAQLWWL